MRKQIYKVPEAADTTRYVIAGSDKASSGGGGGGGGSVLVWLSVSAVLLRALEDVL